MGFVFLECEKRIVSFHVLIKRIIVIAYMLQTKEYRIKCLYNDVMSKLRKKGA